MKKTKLIGALAILATASTLLLTGCPKPTDNPGKSDPIENPDTPDVPDTPDTPDVPDTPDTPDVPETPDTPDTPDTGLIATGSIVKTYFSADWSNEFAGTAVIEDGKIIVNIPEATTQEWQAQVFLSTNGSVAADTCYDVSYVITPSVGLGRYTVKFDEVAQMVYENKLTADAEKTEHFYIKPTGAVENITFIFDFGGNAAQSIEIAELAITEITQEAYDELTYVPPVSGTTNEVLFAQDADSITDALADGLEGWWGTCTYETDTVDGYTVKKCSADVAGGCFGIYVATPVVYKAGAKVQVTAKSSANFKLKPVDPDVEYVIEVTPDEWTTTTFSLGDADGTMEKIGVIVTEAGQVVYISDLRIIDNE